MNKDNLKLVPQVIRGIGELLDDAVKIFDPIFHPEGKVKKVSNNARIHRKQVVRKDINTDNEPENDLEI